jgi:hypothetical protein
MMNISMLTGDMKRKLRTQRSGCMGRPRFIAGEATKAPWLNIKGELCHEYDEYGNHRITLNGVLGEWADFGDIATFKTKDDRLFGATTDHWMNDLPEIFEIQPVVPRSLTDVYRKD